ncbi:hypothetical protein [Actinomyces naeslundii]|uniref:hypothetical protein n=1 Tax=Actinomyces naeslundii TaxID=1655 RepID=UPI00096BD2AA|nr:hypothetical protein [Actinomyces naeslundii]OMG23820.1 hypothetical protein BKH37_02950 [Actinomyces naeslundii]
MDEVTQQVSQEARQAFQVATQLSRLFADISRRRWEHARLESAEQERMVRQTINDQRRLADPVLKQGLDDRFWDKAQPKDAAYVWGVAQRFKDIDPLAAQAAERCRTEASYRWNIDLDAPAAPVQPGQVDDTTLAQTAPVLPGEENRDLKADLAASAELTSQEAPAQPSEASELAAATPDQLFASERQTALEWVREHYGLETIAPNSSEMQQSEAAYVLYSAMAAEGYDMSHPPAFDDLTQAVPGELEAASSSGAADDFAQATGIETADFNRFVDPRATRTIQRIWAADRGGRYPNPKSVQWALATKGSEAVRTVNKVTLPDAPARRGTYTELARRAAADEAGRAGMRPEEYLDHLSTTQRRLLIVTQGQAASHNGPGMGRMAAYRIAYAKEAATRWPTQNHDREPDPRQRAAGSAARQQPGQGHLDVSGLSGAELEAQARASWAQADATAARAAEADAVRRAEQAEAAAQRAQAPADEQSSTGQEIGEVIAPLVVAGTAAATATTVWDSPEARAAWAEGLIANGADPKNVALAVVGDRALHEPASKATAPSKAAATEGRRPPKAETHARTQKQHM